MAKYCSHMILTVSHTEAKQVVDQGIITAAKVRNVYPGIEIKKQFPQSELIRKYRNKLGLRAADKVIGTIGRLARQKSPLDLVRAARYLREKRSDVRIIFVGDGPLRKKVEAEIKRRHLGGFVRVLGFSTEVDTILQVFDIFVLPSLFEGQPISIMEAILHKVPVIATSVNGVPEIIRHEETGLLVPPSDPRALADAVLSLLENEAGKQKFVYAAQKHLRTNYNVHAMAKQIQMIYLELLNSRKG